MKRFMGVWFPRWPIQRLLQGRPELGQRPIVVHVPAARGGFAVLVCSRRAARLGVLPGMPLAEAEALAESGTTACHYEAHDARADLAALKQLAWWCQQFSPLVGLEECERPETLLLDITGCAHLFGGEPAMLTRVVDAFRQRGLYARAAVADTIGAAWGLTHYGNLSSPLEGEAPGVSELSEKLSPHPLSAEKRTADLLDRLPILALRLPFGVVEALHALDIRTVAQLRSLPRATLPSRFGPELLWRLDQALGQIPELLHLERPPEIIEAVWTSDFALRNRRHIETVLHELITQIAGRVHARAQGVQQLICSCHCERQEPVQLSIRLLNASVAVRHLFELVRLQLESCQFPGEVQRIHVRVVGMAPIELHTVTLWDSEGKRCQERHVELLLERLSSRLGEDSVLHPHITPDAQPECLVRYHSVNSGGGGVESGERKRGERKKANPSTLHSPLATLHSLLARPLLVLPEPQVIEVMSIVPEGPPLRFQWREESYTVRWSWGPERIETGWWRGEHIRRDYYRVETSGGQWFWLFRRREDERWFLHGVFE